MATVVFALLGIRLIVKAIKREFVQEKRRDDIRVRDLYQDHRHYQFLYPVCRLCLRLCRYIRCNDGACYSGMFDLSRCFGIYTGYHFGFESKTGAYAAGALLLWVAGGEILLRNVMHMI